jgi:hypothetical protein
MFYWVCLLAGALCAMCAALMILKELAVGLRSTPARISEDELTSLARRVSDWTITAIWIALMPGIAAAARITYDSGSLALRTFSLIVGGVALIITALVVARTWLLVKRLKRAYENLEKSHN